MPLDVSNHHPWAQIYKIVRTFEADAGSSAELCLLILLWLVIPIYRPSWWVVNAVLWKLYFIINLLAEWRFISKF